MKARTFILFLLIPAIGFSQFEEPYEKMVADNNPRFEEYEQLIFEASQYVFENPVDRRSVEFISATQIVGFWMDKKTEINIPAFGSFFESLTNEDHQQFLYTIAMINYSLDQKINQSRLLRCEKIKGEEFSEQEDVREVQLAGAKILLAYMDDPANNVPAASGTVKYLEAFRTGELENIFFIE